METLVVLLSGNIASTSNTVGDNGPCRKDGLVGDPDDPRIYYRCTFNPSSNSFDTASYICSGGQRFNSARGGCADESDAVSNYTCLKQNLDTDASKTCYEETISALTEELDVFIDAVAYRGSPARNFHLSVKDIHLNMRQNYLTLIQNTGQNIFPLIVATDNDTPELAGVGGAYKVYFRNGTMKVCTLTSGVQYANESYLTHYCTISSANSACQLGF